MRDCQGMTRRGFAKRLALHATTNCLLALCYRSGLAGKLGSEILSKIEAWQSQGPDHQYPFARGRVLPKFRLSNRSLIHMPHPEPHGAQKVASHREDCLIALSEDDSASRTRAKAIRLGQLILQFA